VIHFLYGLSLMEMDSMQSALQQFRTTTSFPLKKGEQVYVSAHWYESLCWLSLGRPDSALAKLEVIRGGDNLYVRTFKVEELEEEIRGLERNE